MTIGHARCTLCGWRSIMLEESTSQIVSVFHVMKRHPVEYTETVGKTPEQGELELLDQLGPLGIMALEQVEARLDS